MAAVVTLTIGTSHFLEKILQVCGGLCEHNRIPKVCVTTQQFLWSVPSIWDRGWIRLRHFDQSGIVMISCLVSGMSPVDDAYAQHGHLHEKRWACKSGAVKWIMYIYIYIIYIYIDYWYLSQVNLDST